jgi:hypothetical protein
VKLVTLRITPPSVTTGVTVPKPRPLTLIWVPAGLTLAATMTGVLSMGVAGTAESEVFSDVFLAEGACCAS